MQAGRMLGLESQGSPAVSQGSASNPRWAEKEVVGSFRLAGIGPHKLTTPHPPERRNYQHPHSHPSASIRVHPLPLPRKLKTENQQTSPLPPHPCPSSSSVVENLLFPPFCAPLRLFAAKPLLSLFPENGKLKTSKPLFFPPITRPFVSPVPSLPIRNLPKLPDDGSAHRGHSPPYHPHQFAPIHG